MALSSGYKKITRTQKQSDGNYKKISEWTSSTSVERDNGETIETSVSKLESDLSSLSKTVTNNKTSWGDKYTKNEIDNKFSTLETNIDWKESVATYSDIAKTYPNPADGWTVNVKDTDYTYRYNGTGWVAISANAIPKATTSVDGLLSKTDKAHYDDAYSKRHTHSNKSVIDGITSTLVNNWNSAKTHADSSHARTDATNVAKSTTNGNILINGTETNVYTHPSGTNPHGTTKSDVGLGNVPNVATNDQTPSYTEATSLAKLSSGEKLSVAFSKISKAITDLISHIGDSVKHITSSERIAWNSAYTHSTSTHAPSNAQANVIEIVKVNGSALTPSSKAVNVTVPIKVSQLTNDSGYKTTDNNTTYSLSKSGSTITLTGSDGSKTSVSDSDTNTTYPIAYKTIDGSFITKYRTQTKGNTANGDYISTIRTEASGVNYAPQFGSGLAWGRGDTHGYLYTAYPFAEAYLGGGNADTLNWVKRIQFTDGTGASGTWGINITGTATNATKVNNHTVEANVPANAKFTDTDTWRGIQNNLTSTSTTDSLSAFMGKQLKSMIDTLITTGYYDTMWSNDAGSMNYYIRFSTGIMIMVTIIPDGWSVENNTHYIYPVSFINNNYALIAVDNTSTNGQTSGGFDRRIPMIRHERNYFTVWSNSVTPGDDNFYNEGIEDSMSVICIGRWK